MKPNHDFSRRVNTGHIAMLTVRRSVTGTTHVAFTPMGIYVAIATELLESVQKTSTCTEDTVHLLSKSADHTVNLSRVI